MIDQSARSISAVLRGRLWLLLPVLLAGCQQFVDPSPPLAEASPELPKESPRGEAAPSHLPPPGMLAAPPREFSTDWIAPGLTLGATTDICRIDLTIDEQDRRSAQVVVYRGTPEFNFFGDPLIEPQPDSPLPCRLVRVERRERNGTPIHDGRQLYQVQLDGRADWNLSLVVSQTLLCRSRLLIHGAGVRLLSLRSPIDADVLAKLPPQPENALSFASDTFSIGKRRNGVSVWGTVEGSQVSNSSNGVTLDEVGDVVMSTLVMTPVLRGMANRHDMPDPRGERELFRVNVRGIAPFRAFVVRHRDITGPHRLVLADGDEVKHVVSMFSTDLPMWLREQQNSGDN